MTTESSSVQSSPSSISSVTFQPSVAPPTSLRTTSSVRVETVNVRHVPNPAISAQIPRGPSLVQKSETAEAVTGSNSEERVEEETVNVHKNSLPERIAETRRVLIGSALKFRFGLEDVDTTFRFGTHRNRIRPLGNGILSLLNNREEQAESALITRIPHAIASKFTFPSPNFRRPGVELDLRV